MPVKESIENKGTQLPIYFIINPQAQNGGSLTLWRKIEKVLISQNMHYSARFTERPGHAAKITQQILSSTSLTIILVSIGGDGTLHEIINGAAEYHNAVITCISAGSANDFSRGFSGPRNVIELLSVIRQDKIEPKLIDIGESRIGDKRVLFVNSLGMGIDAEVSNLVNLSAWKKYFNTLKLGKLIYILFFLRKLFSYRRPDIHIEIDGKSRTYSKVWFIVAANQPYFGGGIKIAPKAVPDDGLLNMIIVHDISPLKLLFVFITVYWGGHLGIKNVESFSCREIIISSTKKTAIQTDGEIAGYSYARIRVLKEKLNILPRRI
ncbi:YegS/Rv2252/BmrU family lipid kinase [Peribacillus deserti]|uniref:YegS/Rv2252/BmrU family lipid kinase n=1 Tax=Peribacillus deserti TaxID=673318 RepID=A0ABS2QID7_9BACI|nr:diacylglycerol kinase family protein [Peribacillus deserti]MBM7692941.1 YegS/Rv2252/BmrU family lipid kinase [Peribacillus deserti]